MFNSKKSSRILAVVLTIIFAGILTSCVTFIYTVQNVPSYCQLHSHWCGAACAQMIIQFCCNKMSPPVVPDWYGPLTFNQEYIHGWMEEYQNGHSIPSPYKHPDAIKEVIMGLKSVPLGNYVIFNNTDSGKVMHDMLYWMKKTDYPSATMKGGNHWILVYAFKTNIEPTKDNTVELESISIYDPACYPCTNLGNGANDVPDITAQGWDASYWNEGVKLWPSKPYDGEYIAVVEPPLTKGVVRIRKAYVGKKEEIITVDAAVKKAIGYIKKRKLTRYKNLSYLAKASPQTAFLVERPDRNSHYYLIPFEIEKGKPVKAVMILNAYNGNFFECGVLCRPCSFISKQEAVNLTLKKVGIEKYEKLTASMKYIYSDLTHSHYFPFWEINIDGKLFYLDLNKRVHRKFAAF